MKDALRVYKATEGKNEETVEYLCGLILDNLSDYELFLPEIIRCLTIFLPYDHKLINCFVPDIDSAKKYLLFENEIKRHESLDTYNPYDIYYDKPIKIKMWCDLTDYIVSDSYPELICHFINSLDNVHSKLKGQDPKVAEVYRSIFISMFSKPTVNEEDLAKILTYSGPLWKFMKMIFAETVKTYDGQPISEDAAHCFDSIFKNKQYFISPLESLIFNKNYELAQKVIKYALDEDIGHKLANLVKKNDLFHVDYIVRNYADGDTIQLWKKMCVSLQSKQSTENPYLAQVISNIDEKPASDKQMMKTIKLPEED